MKVKLPERPDPSTTTPDFQLNMVGDKVILLPAAEKIQDKAGSNVPSGHNKRSPIKPKKTSKRSMSNESLSKKGAKVNGSSPMATHK